MLLTLDGLGGPGVAVQMGKPRARQAKTAPESRPKAGLALLTPGGRLKFYHRWVGSA